MMDTSALVPAFLTREEVARLTKRRKFGAQRRVLEERGIRYVPASDGEPLVLRDALGGNKPARERPAHRWDRIGSSPHADVTPIARARR